MDEDLQERPLPGLPAEQKYISFTQFNIPNFVNLEPGSGQGEEELLRDPLAMLEQQAPSQEAVCDIH